MAPINPSAPTELFERVGEFNLPPATSTWDFNSSHGQSATGGGQNAAEVKVRKASSDSAASGGSNPFAAMKRFDRVREFKLPIGATSRGSGGQTETCASFVGLVNIRRPPNNGVPCCRLFKQP